MHIALVHHHVGGKAGGGGGVRLMLELGSGLVRRGHQVTVACHDFLPDSEFSYAADQLEVRSVRRGPFEMPGGRAELAHQYWRDLPHVAELVPADADVVNAHEWLALRPGRIASKRIGAPLVWTRNDESAWERATVPAMTITGPRAPWQRVLQAAMTWPDLLDARHASAIIVLSSQQVEMVRRSYRREALVLPVGPPEHFFSPPERSAARERLGIEQDVFLVVGSGVLVEHRRFEDLIEAIALVEDPRVHGLICGSDHVDAAYADRLAALIAQRGLSDRISLPRRSLSDEQLKDAYAAADVFAILSHRYAWGLAPLEAIASGTPVILTPGAGVYEILAGRPGVHVVPPEDPLAVAKAIGRCRTQGGHAEVAPTTAWLQQEYAFERYVERMENVYEKALARGWGGRGP